MKNYKPSKSHKNIKAYLDISLGGKRKIRTEVTVLSEKDGKYVVTSDFKKTAMVDKWLVMDKLKYDESVHVVRNKIESKKTNEVYCDV